MVKLLLQKGLKVVHESHDPEVYYIYNERMRLQKQFIEVRIAENIGDKFDAQIALLMLDDNSSYEIPIILAHQPPDSAFIWYRVIVDVVELIDNLDPLALIETLKDVMTGYDISKEETNSKVKNVMYNDMVTRFGNIDKLIANANKAT
jgi:hypothetical protein